MPVMSGTVYLVGAGPGDPGMLTVRGAELLRRAEVVVYDHLAAPELLDLCPPACERIYAGKEAGAHTLEQAEIQRLLVARAREGRTVVRLKGGDPFIFGRGGEEALALADEGVDCEVVPGVTAAAGAAACAGIPLTHRGLAAMVTLATGHEDPTKEESGLDWAALASGGTAVFYMGVRQLPAIAARLMEHGRAGSAPAALIRWGTLPRQKTLVAPLERIAGEAERAGMGPPALLVVGEVVALRARLNWFERRPLFGRRVVVTRAAEAGGEEELSDLLAGLGAEVVRFPTIEIRPVPDLGPLDRALEDPRRYDWIVFTSPNGVQVFFERLARAGRDARALAGVRLAAIGPKTAERLAACGLQADRVPGSATSEALLEAFRAAGEELAGKRVLFPGSQIASDLLPSGLEALGARVDRVAVYRTLAPGAGAEELARAFEAAPDLVTFTSGSTARHLAAMLQEAGRGGLLARLRGASIGPMTSAELRKLGVAVAVEAAEHTVPGLARAVERHFREEGA